MAQQWIRVSASSASLVLLLQLALSVLTFGDGGVCPSYPVDPTWKDSISAQEMKIIKSSKKVHLRFQGTFKQGVNVLLNRPSEDSVSNELQEVTMVVKALYPSDSRGVYKVSVLLTLRFRPKRSRFELFSVSENSSARGAPQRVNIVGDGVFDEATGELCVLGCILSVCNYKLRLKYPTPKTILEISIGGNLTSVGAFGDETYFDPISLHAFNDAPFQYTRNATLASVCPSLAPDVEVGKLWNVDDSDEFCSSERYTRTFWESFAVSWNPECKEANCSPFEELGNAAGGSTILALQFSNPSCVGNRVQATLVFTNPYSSSYNLLDPTAVDGTLLAEGIWDSKTRQMCMIACHLYGKQDCEIAITLQLPLTFTVMQRSSIVGHIQSLRKETDPLYFKRIPFKQKSYFGLSRTVELRPDFLEEAGFKEATKKPEYVYTKVETAKAHCANLTEKGKKKKSSSGNYPSGEDWHDYSRFNGVKDLLSPRGRREYYEMDIFTRGNEFVAESIEEFHYHDANVTGLGVAGSVVQDRIMNVSYAMHYRIGPWEGYDERMAGEGVYDSNTGKLCLIGCRAVDLKHKGLQQLEGDAQKDCQTFFSLQLPRKGSIERCKGTVKSLRPPSDPLYFKPESFSGSVYMQAADSIWRIDLEIVLSILMLSLTVVFLLLQLVYSRRYPETLPYISISMMLILSLAHMIPLVVDLEALLQNQGSRRRIWLMYQRVGGWPEVNKAVVRLTTMAAMLLQLRFLQLVWKSRTEALVTGKLAPAVHEGRLLYYILPLYIAGGLIAILAHAKSRFKPYERAFLWRNGQGGVWWDLHAYAGLLLDLHLLPQVIANILWDATQQAPLSKWFYMGMALVRSVPHLYDLCRRFRFIPLFSDMYLYANPEWDFYSVASDILIPFFVVLLAIMVFMQQRWGGRCVLPRRCRNHLEYEKVENPIAP